MIEITEREVLAPRKHILLTTTVDGVTFWRAWYPGSVKTLEDKRKALERDVEWHKTK